MLGGGEQREGEHGVAEARIMGGVLGVGLGLETGG